MTKTISTTHPNGNNSHTHTKTAKTMEIAPASIIYYNECALAVLIKSGDAELRARAHSTGSSNGPIRVDRRACVLPAPRDCSWRDDGKWNNKLAGGPVSFQFSGQVEHDERLAGNDTGAHSASRAEPLSEPEADFDSNSNSDDTQKELMELLKKSSFTCLLIGARQSGKRTIVKCFVKLLNEFMLAVDEYRKERSLAKLIDCTDRLQQQQLELEMLANEPNRRISVQRSRVNSWLGGANKLLNLPAHLGSSKRRLNSMCPPVRLHELAPFERRHTAIDSSFRLHANDHPTGSALLRPDSSLSQSRRLNSAYNKSDYDISYSHSHSQSANSNPDSSSNHLQVPSVCSPQTSPVSQSRRSMRASTQLSGSASVRQQRLQSMQLQSARTRPLISLKELNKRRVKVKFKTRRQLNDSYLNPQAHADQTALDPPDSFLVIYSINDR